MMRYCCCLGARTKEAVEEAHRKGAAAWYLYQSADIKDAKPELLTEAIDFYNQALTRAPSEHPLRPRVLIDLIFALLEEKSPSSQVLSLIQLHFAEVIGTIPPTLERGQGFAITDALGAHYERLYKVSSDPNDFEHCVDNYTEAARAYAPGPEEQIKKFLKAAELHSTREEDAHLEKALNAFHAARGLCQDEAYQQRFQISIGTYTVHKKRYEQRKEKADLDAAIAECDYALTLQLPEKDRIRLLSSYLQYAGFLMAVHGRGSSRKAKAVARGRELLDLYYATYSDAYEPKCTVLSVLANILSWEGGTPSSEDLAEAILLYSRAQRHRPRDPDLLSDKARAIWLRSKQRGDPADLPEAIDLLVVALEETPNPSLKPDIANDIAAIYFHKASFNGDKSHNIRDLEKVREYYRKAADLSSTDIKQKFYKELADEIDKGIREPESQKEEVDRGRTRRLSGGRRRSLTRRASIGPR
ncbi:hypothetical protein D9611_013201 [Ephemerocybe angulata]|uniref:Uncharacterized protein n=1 Tax=Ephemerocybe angulata TaxID=980116 RepID=A0A8H5F9V6_9AGAR|nr:hypothetical protein D9611_013201 [Tulosesus angulatus]